MKFYHIKNTTVKIHERTWVYFVDIFYVMAMAEPQPNLPVESALKNSPKNSTRKNQSSKNEIKRPGECAFSRGNWCDYEQDPDDDLDWSISSDGYALILLNQHQKLQYGRLLSPFIRSKVSYKSFLVNFLLIFDGFYCYP